MKKAWQNENDLRAIYWLEFNQLKNFEGDKNDLNAIQNFLNNRFETVYKTSPNASFFKSQFEKYTRLKPIETKFKNDKNSSFEKVIFLSKPIKRQFEIIRIK
jgi:hypothetical protein